MKFLILFIATTPYFSIAQNTGSALNLSGGGEYQKANSHSWNIELSYQDRIANSERFWSEFGVNFNVLEYKGDPTYRLDTINTTVNTLFLPFIVQDYFLHEAVHYSRNSSLRFQVGANFNFIEQEKLKVSVGLNFVTQLRISHKRHGQRLYLPIPGMSGDTLDVINTAFSSTFPLNRNVNQIDLYLQPHVDLSYLIGDNLALTSRLAYYRQVLNDDKRVQLNAGVRYYFK